jgi:hypothetical protein
MLQMLDTGCGSRFQVFPPTGGIQVSAEKRLILQIKTNMGTIPDPNMF